MSLTSLWNDLQYKMARWGLYEPESVRQDLLKQGWTFETETVPCATMGIGAIAFHAVTVIKTPEGVATITDDAAQKRYNQAYLQAVDKAFNRAPAP